ncbi:MAG: GGDEF domain-containing protein [Solirubrobacteraceae bacterium]
MITGLCLLGVAEYRNARLVATHEEISRAQLLAMARSFGGDFAGASLERPQELRNRLLSLVRMNPSLQRATVHAAGARPGTRAVASTGPSPPRAGRRELRPLETGRPHYGEEGTGARRSGELAFPLGEIGGRPAAVIELDLSLESLDRRMARERAIGIIAAFLGAAVAAALSGAAIERVVVRPLCAVRLAAHRIARGRYDTRLHWTRPDEIGELARAFDAMGGRLEDSRAKLKSLASIDALTGVINRRAFRGALRAELRRAGRERYPVALVALDLDHFKEVNDERGHGAGDEALRQVADAIGAELRPGDVCGRIGGDEFMIALPQTDGLNAVAVVERLRASVVDLALGSVERNVTLSIGVAEFPAHSREDEELMRIADLALYLAKQGGRDRYQIYPGDSSGAANRTPPASMTIRA